MFSLIGIRNQAPPDFPNRACIECSADENRTPLAAMEGAARLAIASSMILRKSARHFSGCFGHDLKSVHGRQNLRSFPWASARLMSAAASPPNGEIGRRTMRHPIFQPIIESSESPSGRKINTSDDETDRTFHSRDANTGRGHSTDGMGLENNRPGQIQRPDRRHQPGMPRPAELTQHQRYQGHQQERVKQA